MLFTKLGSLNVSKVCLGTMTWGEQNTEEEAFEQLDYFIAASGNFIDTAELYPVPPCPETCGSTERIIGRWMQARGNRKDIVLATKVMGGGGDTRNFVPAARTDPPSADAPNGRLEPAQINAAVNASLRRLQTTYVDLIQLHWPDRYAPLWGANQFRPEKAAAFQAVPFADQLTAVKELIAEGKVREWGVSNETAFGIAKLCEAARLLDMTPPVSIQNDFSLLDRRFEGSLAEACYHETVGLLVYGGLAGGTLTDKYHQGSTPPPGARHVKFPNFQQRYHCPASMAAAARYSKLARSKGMSTAALALAWCKSRWYVSSVIIGATTMEQLKTNIDAFEVDLDQDTLAEIDALHLQCRNPNVTD